MLAVEPEGAQAAEAPLKVAGATTVRAGLNREATAILREQLGPTEYTPQAIERGMWDQARLQ